MANRSKKLFMNFPGEFYVDSSCINCDACRQIAPATFAEAEDYAYVKAQPDTANDERKALRALVACPTGSIGTEHPNDVADVLGDFPLQLAPNIYYCGFNSRKSFGGNSYFVTHDSGNWLIDSPRMTRRLRHRFSELGGIDFIFLSHRDDVADAAEFAQLFGSQRIIHAAELSAQPDAEIVISGTDPVEPIPGFRIIPTPGHTRGHCCLLLDNRFLFTGDHFWWDRYRDRMTASRDVCWYSWEEQITSLKVLQGYSFEWVLPAHGERQNRSAEEMDDHLTYLVNTLKNKK